MFRKRYFQLLYLSYQNKTCTSSVYRQGDKAAETVKITYVLKPWGLLSPKGTMGRSTILTDPTVYCHSVINAIYSRLTVTGHILSVIRSFVRNCFLQIYGIERISPFSSFFLVLLHENILHSQPGGRQHYFYRSHQGKIIHLSRPSLYCQL